MAGLSCSCNQALKDQVLKIERDRCRTSIVSNPFQIRRKKVLIVIIDRHASLSGSEAQPINVYICLL